MNNDFINGISGGSLTWLDCKDLGYYPAVLNLCLVNITF